jgi:hypothetical protein
MTSTDDLPNNIHLGIQDKLRTLRIFAPFDSESTALMLTRVFSNLTAPHLEYIILDFLVQCVSWTWVNWEEFDRALCNHAFGSLRSVEILVGSDFPWVDLDKFNREFTNQLPLLTGRGLLKVRNQ